MATLPASAVSAAAGLFGTDGVPHVVQGVTGRRHATPVGAESSTVTNVLRGSANVAVAGVLLWMYWGAREPATVLAAFLAGVAPAVALAACVER